MMNILVQIVVKTVADGQTVMSQCGDECGNPTVVLRFSGSGTNS
jgi:hypothetical protein